MVDPHRTEVENHYLKGRAIVRKLLVLHGSVPSQTALEVILGAMGAAISNTLADSIFDVFLGVCGGALGGWFADRYLDRIFGRSRHDPHQRRVR